MKHECINNVINETAMPEYSIEYEFPVKFRLINERETVVKKKIPDNYLMNEMNEALIKGRNKTEYISGKYLERPDGDYFASALLSAMVKVTSQSFTCRNIKKEYVIKSKITMEIPSEFSDTQENLESILYDNMNGLYSESGEIDGDETEINGYPYYVEIIVLEVPTILSAGWGA